MFELIGFLIVAFFGFKILRFFYHHQKAIINVLQKNTWKILQMPIISLC
jgi:hypothetical protein